MESNKEKSSQSNDMNEEIDKSSLSQGKKTFSFKKPKVATSSIASLSATSASM